MPQQRPSEIINFLLIGVQKAGTTWLSEALKQHADVFIPEKKEIHFYNSKIYYGKGYDYYLAHFSDRGSARAVGECTPDYFWNGFTDTELSDRWFKPDALETISRDLPDAKFLVSFRNPIDRAVSGYYHQMTRGRLPPNAKLRDVADQHGIVTKGYYATIFKDWLKHFDRKQFCVFIFEEDIQPDAAKRATLERACAHLDIAKPDSVQNLYFRQNDKRDPAWKYLSRLPGIDTNWRVQKFANRVNEILPTQVQERLKPDITDADYAFLQETFASSIAELEAFLDRKLPWLDDV